MIYDAIGTPITQVIMSYAEVQLHFQQWDRAKEAYEKGVSAALTQWPSSTMPENYFANPAAAFDGSLEKIMGQKYLALYFNDYQQWYEHRRTGFPVLPKTAFMLNEGIMPSRFMYHNDVQRFNPDNYREVVNRIGEDGFYTKVWWEKQS